MPLFKALKLAPSRCSRITCARISTEGDRSVLVWVAHANLLRLDIKSSLGVHVQCLEAGDVLLLEKNVPRVCLIYPDASEGKYVVVPMFSLKLRLRFLRLLL